MPTFVCSLVPGGRWVGKWWVGDGRVDDGWVDGGWVCEPILVISLKSNFRLIIINIIAWRTLVQYPSVGKLPLQYG